MVSALIRTSFEALVLLPHTKHLAFEIEHFEAASTTGESNPNPSHAFEVASRYPNLCVLQGRCLAFTTTDI